MPLTGPDLKCWSKINYKIKHKSFFFADILVCDDFTLKHYYHGEIVTI